MDDDRQICLRWKNHQSTLVSQLDSLLVNELLVDCTLATEGKYVRAHKVVLSACSPYFETLIGLHYDKHPVFILNNVKYEELQAIMDYMYRGEVNISQDELGAILKAARLLQIRGLSENKGSEDKKLKRPASPQQQPVASESAHLNVSKEKSNQQSTTVDSDSASESRGTSPKLRKRRKVSRCSEDENNISAKTTQDDPDVRVPVQSSFDQSHFDKPPCQQMLDVSKNMTSSTSHTESLLEPKSEYVAEAYNADSNGIQDYDQLQGPSNKGEGPSEDPSLLHSQGALDRHNSAQLNMEQSLLTLFNSPGVSSAVHPKIPEGYFVPGNYSKGGKRTVNLDEVLNCYDGKQILDAGNLNHNSRRKLCEIIVNFELRDDYDKRIRSSLLKKYSEAIVAKFPTEKSKIYYIGPRTIKGKKLQARGILWSKYTTTRKSLKKRGLIKRRTTNDTDTEQTIDIQKLRFLTESDIKDLIPNNIGLRARFRAALNNFLGRITSTVDIIGSDVSESSLSEDTDSQSNSSCRSGSRASSRTDRHEQLYRSVCFDFHLPLILKNSIKGRLVLAEYSKLGVLSPKARSGLVDCIIEHCLQSDHNRVLHNQDHDILASKIVKLFPTEVKSVYYVPPQTEGRGQLISKGKLIDRYRNQKRFLKKSGLTPTNVKKVKADRVRETPTDHPTVVDIDSEIDVNEQLQAQIWLKHNKAPWTEVESKWNISFPLRKQNIYDVESTTVASVVSNCLSLKQPLGYTLIESDFAKLYKDKELCLLLKWKVFRAQMLPLLKLKIRDNSSKALVHLLETEDLTEDQRDTITAYLLPAFIISHARIPVILDKKKRTWRPNTAESQEGFIMQCMTVSDIRPKLLLKQDKFKLQGLTLQPVIIAVGESIQKAEDFYVCFDDILYKLDSCLKAIDIAFKLHHVLGATYAPESFHVWLFIQQYFYGLRTKYDKSLSEVSILISRLQTE